MGASLRHLHSFILVLASSFSPFHARAAQRRVRLSAIEAPPSPGRNWYPPPHKFLVAICQYGRLTNQVLCMRSYLELARVSNRTLLIPDWGVAANWGAEGIAYRFRWHTPVDWDRMAKCLAPDFGAHTVMTAADYVSRYQRPAQVTFYQGLTRLRKWAYPESLAMRELKRLNEGSLALPPLSAVPEDPILAGFGKARPPPADVVRAVGALQDEVISFGEMFNFEMQPRLEPLRGKEKGCTNLWYPHAHIMQFVDGVVQSQLGGRYAALHLRRGDFYRYRSLTGKIRGKDLEKQEGKTGFRPIVGIATEIQGWLKKMKLSRLYVATNAGKLEIELFKAVLQDSNNSFSVDPVLTLDNLRSNTDWLMKQEWAKGALQLAIKPESNEVVLSLIDKFICVKADRFWGTHKSSFSREIIKRLRGDEHLGRRH